MRPQVDLDFILNRHRIDLESVSNQSRSDSVEIEVEVEAKAEVGAVEVAETRVAEV